MLLCVRMLLLCSRVFVCSIVIFTLLDLCVSSLRRGHANLHRIVPISTDAPRRESRCVYLSIYLSIYIYIYTYMCIYIYIYGISYIMCIVLYYSHIYIYIYYLYVILCMCIYIYIYVYSLFDCDIIVVVRPGLRSGRGLARRRPLIATIIIITIIIITITVTINNK